MPGQEEEVPSALLNRGALVMTLPVSQAALNLPASVSNTKAPGKAEEPGKPASQASLSSHRPSYQAVSLHSFLILIFTIFIEVQLIHTKSVVLMKGNTA